MKRVMTLALVLAAMVPVQAESSFPVEIVFAGLAEGGTWDIWAADRAGTQFLRITDTPDVDERSPALSPDRRFIAWSTSRGEIVLYDLHASAPRPLALPSSGRHSCPVWGADHSELYYVELLLEQGPDDARIWQVDVDSAKGRTSLDQPLMVEGWPWVSDRGELVFTTWTATNEGVLWMKRAGSSAAKKLWDRALSISGTTMMADGTIAVICGDHRGQKVMMLDGEKLLREYDSPGASGRPAAFGDQLLLTRVVDGRAAIFVMSLEDGASRPWLAALPEGLSQARDPDCGR